MTLTIFVKCDKCGELEKANNELVGFWLTEHTSTEQAEMTYTCGNCNAESAANKMADIFFNNKAGFRGAVYKL